MSQLAWNLVNWKNCKSQPLHPLKVIIVEALLWIEKPLSARSIELMTDGAARLDLISYHLRKLAADSVVKKVEERVGRGTVQKFYRLSC